MLTTILLQAALNGDRIHPAAPLYIAAEAIASRACIRLALRK